jgi:hypothetical protein
LSTGLALNFFVINSTNNGKISFFVINSTNKVKISKGNAQKYQRAKKAISFSRLTQNSGQDFCPRKSRNMK